MITPFFMHRVVFAVLLVNVELPFFYLHEVTQTSAAAKVLRNYQPGSAGALAYHGGGLRAAYIAT